MQVMNNQTSIYDRNYVSVELLILIVFTFCS